MVPCLDDKTADSLIPFIKTVLDKAASGSISDLLSLVKTI
jgi:hypothetical protein